MKRPGPRQEIVEELCAAIEQDRRGVVGIAEASGVNNVTIYWWLDGTTRNPTPDAMAKVAAVLGRRLAWVDDHWALERLSLPKPIARRACTSAWLWGRQ